MEHITAFVATEQATAWNEGFKAAGGGRTLPEVVAIGEGNERTYSLVGLAWQDVAELRRLAHSSYSDTSHVLDIALHQALR